MHDYQKEELTQQIALFVSNNRKISITKLEDQIKKIFDNYFDDTITDGWGIEDVKQQATEEGYEISDDDARSVLNAIDHHYDANIGINWDVISYWINNSGCNLKR